MKKVAIPILLALLLVTAVIVPFVPVNKVYSLIPETETFVISVQKDSFLTQGSEKHNEGANVILDLQSSDKRRPVVAFDQNEIIDSISGRILQSAILKLFVIDNGNNWGPDGNSIGAHRLVADWHEGNGWNVGNNIAGTGSGVTWGCAIDADISNNQNDCATQWNGGSFQSPATSNFLITNSLENQWVSFDVTSDLQAFLDGTANHGWLIKKTSESLNGDVVFASKETTANNPVLEITVFRPEAVLANEYLGIIDELNEVGESLDEAPITQGLIDDIDSDLARIKDIVVELQTLGFDGEASAGRVGQQMVGTVKFYDTITLTPLFETQIPDGTLGIFAAIGLRDQFSEEGLDLPFERVASLLNLTRGIGPALTNFEDDEIAREFVLGSIEPFHPSTGNTFSIVSNAPKIARIIYNVILKCFSNIPCKVPIEEIGKEVTKNKILEFLFPTFVVTGSKFNDVNGNGMRDEQDPGIQGWHYVVSTFNAPRIFEGFTNATGIFAIEAQYPRSSHTLVVTETLQSGWSVTTPSGEIHNVEVGDIPLPDLLALEEAKHTRLTDPFGNFQLGEISGFKYNDANGNGAQDTGEEGLSGWIILLKNATSGATINSTTTGAGGLYLFTGLQFGSYRVEEVQQEGYTQTEPATGYYGVNIQSGTFSLGNDFGNRIDAPDPDVIWYGSSHHQGFSGDAVTRLQNFGFDVERGSRPIADLTGTTVVVITGFGIGTASQFTAAEVAELQSFVNNGGRLILAVDTDYFHCNPDSLCAAEVATNFGFGFDGSVQTGSLVPSSGQSTHPIWRTPNALSSFSNWCCDAYVNRILDSNVKVIARVSGSSPELGEPTRSLSNVPAIVLNENPAFNSGKVMGGGYNMILGWNNDFRLFDNIMTYMLGQTVGGAPGGPYHYVEVNQTSANVTGPDSVTIEVEVEWYDPAWPAQPVEIALGNMTGTGITYNIESIYNSTEYQIFQITFNVAEDVQPGEYTIPIVARDLEDGYFEQSSFLIRVE